MKWLMTALVAVTASAVSDEVADAQAFCRSLGMSAGSVVTVVRCIEKYNCIVIQAECQPDGGGS